MIDLVPPPGGHESLPPQDISAERALLGAIYIGGLEALNAVASTVAPGDFYLEKHRLLYDCFSRLATAGEPIDSTLVLSDLRTHANGSACEWELELFDLPHDGLWLHAGSYARVVADKAARRRLLGAADELARLGYQESSPWADILGQATAIAQRAITEAGARAGEKIGAFSPLLLPELVAGDIAAVDWLVDGLLPRGGIGIHGADAGTFKSWCSLDLAIAVATGTPWMGRFACARGRVLYIDEESTLNLLQRRISKLLIGRGIVDPLDSNDILFLSREGITLDNAEKMAQLSDLVSSYQPMLIIMDAIQDVFLGDENSAKDVGGLFHAIRSLQRVGGAAMWALHHTKKPTPNGGGTINSAAQMLRGSTRFRGEVDTYLYSAKTQEGQVQFEHEKSRHGEPTPGFRIAVEDTPDGTGTVVRFVSESQSEMQKHALARMTILNLLDEYGPTARPDIIAACGRLAIGERTLDPILKGLIEEGIIAKNSSRPRRYRILRDDSRQGEL